MADRPDAPGRVAWTYLASLLAGVAGALLAIVLRVPLLPAICGGRTGELGLDCSFVISLLLLLAGFLLALVGTLVLFKVADAVWLWLAMLAGLAGLAAVADLAGQWWFWVLLVLVPAAAALASLRWPAPARVWLGQRVAIVAAALGACGAVAAQFVLG
jgi:hypothetical protein